MNNDDLIDNILAYDFTEDEEKARKAINDATDVDFTLRTPGWNIVLDVLEEIKLEAENTALDQLPGNNDAIIAAHAVAYAVRNTHKTLLETLLNIRDGRQDALAYLENKANELNDLNELTDSRI